MPRFSLGKLNYSKSVQNLDHPRNTRLPSEQKTPKVEDLLVFIVDDEPDFLQILNTHFSKLQLKTDKGKTYRWKIKNFTTGRSCLQHLDVNPDLIILNYYINNGLPDALKGKDILDEIALINPNQKILILNEIEGNLREAFVENGLRDYLIKDEAALDELNRRVLKILNER